MSVYTVTSDKGGVGKSTTAVHIAAYLSRLAPTLLVDGDAIKTSVKWSRKGNGGGLPFKVATHAQMVSHIRDHTHVVIDTEGNPTDDELKDLAESCDLLIIPAVPEGPANDGLIETLARLNALPRVKYRVLLTKVPPRPKRDGELLRAELEAAGVPTFRAEIPLLTAYERAYNAGVPVYGVKGDPYAARAWAAYECAGEEIISG